MATHDLPDHLPEIAPPVLATERKPVDVLAVMKGTAEQFGITDDFGAKHRVGLYEARAAVAELIEATAEAELVFAEKLRRLGSDPNVSPTIHKLRAALARVQGGAK